MRPMSRGRQVLRQWTVLRALERSRRGLTVRDLVALLEGECTERTVYRDLEQLLDAGFPIADDEGTWRVLGTSEGAWSIPVQPTELLGLTLAEDLFSPAEGSWLSAPLRDLRQRLAAMLTPNGRKYLDLLRQSAVATLFAPGAYEERRAEIDAILEAIEKQHVLRIAHVKPGEERSWREVEPYSTWYHAGQLYLIAFCRRVEDIRTFAVHRIVGAEVLDEDFDPDPSFDAAAFARKGFGVFHGPVYRFVIDFDPEVAHVPRERSYHASQRVRERPDGTVRMTFEAAGLPEVAAWVAGFGGKAVPVEPAELVGTVRDKFSVGLQRLG